MNLSFKMKALKLLAATAAAAVVSTAASAATLDDVKAKGFIQCGVTTGLAGFAAPDDKGVWKGFDVDFCRAMAAAIFGDPMKVKFTPTTGKTRFTALASGEIDVLINTTSFRPMKKFMEDTIENWQLSITKNSLSMFVPSRLIGKRMAKKGKGSIINFSSIYGLVSPPMKLYENSSFETEPDYPFLKSGTIGLSKFLSSYFAKDGVRVNVIAPGGVFNQQEESFLEKYTYFNPMGRMATPEDLVGLVIFLASDASNYVTGTVIPVDGGWTAV